MFFVVRQAHVVSLEGQWCLPIASVVFVQSCTEDVTEASVLDRLGLLCATNLAAVVELTVVKFHHFT